MRYYKVENHITNEFAIIEETIYKQMIDMMDETTTISSNFTLERCRAMKTGTI